MDGLTSAPKVGFWVSPATTTGTRSSVELQLSPGPTSVEYPNMELGEMIDTADGRVVMQVGNADPRRHAWLWANYGPEVPNYERQYRWLESLKSRFRYASGQSPYVYVYDGTSRRLHVTRSLEITGASLNGTTVTVPSFASKVNAAHLRDAVLEVLPATGGSAAAYERRSVLTAPTSTTLTLPDAFSTNTLGASKLRLTWTQPVWWKVRVLDTIRELRNEGGSVRYPMTRFQFVIDEPMGTIFDTLGA